MFLNRVSPSENEVLKRSFGDSINSYIKTEGLGENPSLIWLLICLSLKLPLKRVTETLIPKTRDLGLPKLGIIVRLFGGGYIDISDERSARAVH